SATANPIGGAHNITSRDASSFPAGAEHRTGDRPYTGRTQHDAGPAEAAGDQRRPRSEQVGAAEKRAPNDASALPPRDH
ncbi:MAG: hypothetical protein QOI25_886, partial [Mycobacterium sp.]|nr:hypothetical protein [Mycobacterium sp.]